MKLDATECQPHIKEIKAAIDKKGMTSADLLEALEGKVSSNYIYTLLRGETGTSSDKLDAIKAAIRGWSVKASTRNRRPISKREMAAKAK